MPTKRHYCDGHEYRYCENNGTDGEAYVYNNYGTLTVCVSGDLAKEYLYFNGCEASGDYVEDEFFSVHINDPSVATFDKRAELAIRFAAQCEENRD